MPCFLWCRCLGGGLWKYLPLRLERPQLLNHQPPVKTRKNIRLDSAIKLKLIEWFYQCDCHLQLTRKVLGAVEVVFLIVVLVTGGERQATGGVSPQGSLQGTESADLLSLERVLCFLSTQMEGQADGCRVIPPVGELDVEDVAAIFSDGVDFFKTQPELSWRRQRKVEGVRKLSSAEVMSPAFFFKLIYD